jgi:hypothetical protein
MVLDLFASRQELAVSAVMRVPADTGEVAVDRVAPGIWALACGTPQRFGVEQVLEVDVVRGAQVVRERVRFIIGG